jgi:ribosome-binding protein aMBF1 (putative translation factor)
MSIKEKIAQARESNWLKDSLTIEERIAAESIAQIAATIQRQRKILGYSQQELATKLGVSQTMVSRWENGEENFTVHTLAKISAAIGMKLHNPLEKRVV